MSIEPATPVPVTDKARLEDTLRKVKNVKSFLQGMTVHASNALALLECLDLLAGMEVRIGQDIAASEAT